MTTIMTLALCICIHLAFYKVLMLLLFYLHSVCVQLSCHFYYSFSATEHKGHFRKIKLPRSQRINQNYVWKLFKVIKYLCTTLKNRSLRVRNHLSYWIKRHMLSGWKAGFYWTLTSKILGRLTLYIESTPRQAHMGTTATSWVEKSLLEFGICKSWIWIFHQLLQGTWSKNTSNSPGNIRLYKAARIWTKGCTMSTQEGPLSTLVSLSLRLTINSQSRT